MNVSATMKTVGGGGGGGGGVARATPKIALVMGVANHRSIAWNCVESFLSLSSQQQHPYANNNDWNVIVTYHPDHHGRVQSLLSKTQKQQQQSSLSSQPRIFGIPCNVETDIPQLCHERIPELLQSIQQQYQHQDNNDSSSNTTQQQQPQQLVSSSTTTGSSSSSSITAIVHSVAFGNLKGQSLLQTSRNDFLKAHDISSYSLLEITQQALQSGIIIGQQQSQQSQQQQMQMNVAPSITTLSYIGSQRAMKGYHIMGPAKASLEAIVRGLALELGHSSSSRGDNSKYGIHVNAVSAGPIATLSSKGGIDNFSTMKEYANQRAPMGSVTALQVASMVTYLANQPIIIGGSGGGITGQTIYVDGGYSSVDGPIL